MSAYRELSPDFAERFDAFWRKQEAAARDKLTMTAAERRALLMSKRADAVRRKNAVRPLSLLQMCIVDAYRELRTPDGLPPFAIDVARLLGVTRSCVGSHVFAIRQKGHVIETRPLGVPRTSADAEKARAAGLDPHTVRVRLKLGWTREEAFSRPVRRARGGA